jgi:hypothetical protein
VASSTACSFHLLLHCLRAWTVPQALTHVNASTRVPDSDNIPSSTCNVYDIATQFVEMIALDTRTVGMVPIATAAWHAKACGWALKGREAAYS